jgi:hypothetical protein
MNDLNACISFGYHTLLTASNDTDSIDKGIRFEEHSTSGVKPR